MLSRLRTCARDAPRCFGLTSASGRGGQSALWQIVKPIPQTAPPASCAPGIHRLVAASAAAGSSPPAAAAAPPNPHEPRQRHNKQQAAVFEHPEVVKEFLEELPSEIQQRLKLIADSVPGLGETSRVIDVGSGTGCLVPYLRARGVKDILAVDLSEAMLAELRRRWAPDATHLGNDIGVRTWQGDIVDLPNYLGWAADATFFNGVFGNLHDPRAALVRCALMLKAGGHIVISHPMGRPWHAGLQQQQPDITPHQLPDRTALEQLIQGLPLRVAAFHDEPHCYLAVLQIPPRYAFPGAPVRMHGKVVTGFGRGSKQMGTPTANIDPGPLEDQLKTLERGVYFGWARLAAAHGAGWSEADLGVHKCVMNVGRRPTVNTGDEAATVEVHIMHEFAQDFYAQDLKVVVLGYVRPEMRFTGGLPELINRIKIDKAVGANQLEDPEHKAFAMDAFLN